jgi:hypothetical protein
MIKKLLTKNRQLLPREVDINLGIIMNLHDLFSEVVKVCPEWGFQISSFRTSEIRKIKELVFENICDTIKL